MVSLNKGLIRALFLGGGGLGGGTLGSHNIHTYMVDFWISPLNFVSHSVWMCYSFFWVTRFGVLHVVFGMPVWCVDAISQMGRTKWCESLECIVGPLKTDIKTENYLLATEQHPPTVSTFSGEHVSVFGVLLVHYVQQKTAEGSLPKWPFNMFFAKWPSDPSSKILPPTNPWPRNGNHRPLQITSRNPVAQ